MNGKMIKKIGIGAVATAMMATAGGISIAYLTQEEQVVNVFTVGDLELGLKEPEWEPEKGDGLSMVPGNSIYKNPTIKNITPDKNGGQSCYARMCLSIKDKNGRLITDPDRLSLIREIIRFDDSYTGDYQQKGTAQKIVEGRIPGYSLEEIRILPMVNPLFELDKQRSTENKLIFNYMGTDQKGALKIGEEAALFTTIAVPIEWTKKEIDLLGEFQLEVVAQAIQTAGFAGQSEALAVLDAEKPPQGGTEPEETEAEETGTESTDVMRAVMHE